MDILVFPKPYGEEEEREVEDFCRSIYMFLLL